MKNKIKNENSSQFKMNHCNNKGSHPIHSCKPIATARAIMKAFHQIVLTQVCSSYILILYISNLKWVFSKWYQVKITFAQNLNRHQQFYQVFSHSIWLWNTLQALITVGTSLMLKVIHVLHVVLSFRVL